MSITATLFAQIIAFALVVWMVNRLLWKPLSAAMEKRRTEISDGLSAAEEGRRVLQDAGEKKTEIQKEAHERAAEIIAKAQKQADEIVESAKERAHEEGERVKAAAQSEIEGEYNRAKETLRGEVAALALAGAARILEREVKSGDHDATLKEIEKGL